MIHKIEKIDSIGKFRSYQASGNVAFQKVTLIYADNGSGKTTISSILRSLTIDNPELIRNRVSTDAAIPQSAQIIQRTNRDTHHTFGPRGWSVAFPDIEIFDIHFINENVYSGFDFNEDQKKHLHEFVIGAQGIGIKQQIEQNKANKTQSRQDQTRIEQEILQHVGNGLVIDALNKYLGVTAAQAENIDQQINAAQSVLDTSNSNAVIQTLSNLTMLSRVDLRMDLNLISTDLQENIQTIQDAALKMLFDYHCVDLAANSLLAPENWIRQGVHYVDAKIRDDNAGNEINCPFCNQVISYDLEIMKAYALHFNEAFNALIAKLQVHFNKLQAVNLEAIILPISNTIQNNSRHSTIWATYLPIVPIPVYDISVQVPTLKISLDAVLTAITEKKQNLSVAGNVESIRQFNQVLKTINSRIDAYNIEVQNYNTAIATFRAGIKLVAQAQVDLNRLRCIKMRFESPVDDLCESLLRQRTFLKGLENEYITLVQQQESSSRVFLASYKDRINYYLTDVFKTPFRIENVVHVAPQGRSTQSKIGYKLTINAKDISFDPNTLLCAMDCLSEGDRSTIALSLFLSKLDIDPQIADKIIVFDDPLSSFDSKRRLYTVELIHHLLPRIHQIIVLSHNEFFLHDISKGVAAGDKITLRITEDFVTKASLIEPLTLETVVENDYYKYVKELEAFLFRGDITKKDLVLGWMRNVLEAHIRFKFYRQTNHLQPNNRTFGNLITALCQGNAIFRDNANRDLIFSRLRLINAISSKPHHGEATPDFATLSVNPNTITVTELANFVQDTLDLIDNKL